MQASLYTPNDIMSAIILLTPEQIDRVYLYTQLVKADSDAEAQWERLFAATTDAQWTKMAAHARSQIKEGKVRSLITDTGSVNLP